MKKVKLIILLSSLLPGARMVQADSELIVDSGYQKSVGDYGQDTQTTIKSIPLGFTIIENDWSLQLWTSYLSVTGNGSVIPTSGGVGNATAAAHRSNPAAQEPSNNAISTEIVRQAGVGDTSVDISYSFSDDRFEDLFLSISAQVKLATADANKNLGTGETDYLVQVNGAYEKNKLTPFLSLGYVFMGDSADIEYNNAIYASFGIDYAIEPSLISQLSYDFREGITENSKSFKQINASISWRPSNKWAVNFSMLSGLTNAAPDTGAAFGITYHY